jgi:hypothetical protein
MIRYALYCEHDHAFEAWFGSSGDYDVQAAKGLVECPMCLSTTVRKQVMSPAIATSRRRGAPESTAIVPSSAAEPTLDGPGQQVASTEVQAQMRSTMMEALGKVRRHVEETCDYVGDSFAKEARDIHEGRSEQRGIYGEASPKEVKALLDDGITVAPLPPEPVVKTKRELN